MACLTNKEINNFILNNAHPDKLRHIQECKRCSMRYDIIKKTLDKMAEYPCFTSNASD